jgi:hypothetical protein
MLISDLSQIWKARKSISKEPTSDRSERLMRIEVLMAVPMKITVFWDVTLCCLVDRFLQNVCTYLQVPDHMASHPRNNNIQGKRRLNLGNTYYYAVQNLLSSLLLIKTYD